MSKSKVKIGDRTILIEGDRLYIDGYRIKQDATYGGPKSYKFILQGFIVGLVVGMALVEFLY